MPARFARGVHAYALCDRCGQRYEYLALKVEWTGSFVCPDCFETKHPQLSPPKNIHDPQGLKNPRPDRVEPLTTGINGASTITDPFVYPGTPVPQGPPYDA